MKKEITISHLVVNGCSFTYCEGLDSPATQGWPALLAQKLGVPVVNIALGGTSNFRIYRKSVDYFFKDTGSNPFYIIGMTSCTRLEQYLRKRNDYVALNLIGKPPSQFWEAQLLSLLRNNSDPLILAKQKLDIWLSIINLFKAPNINYLTVDMLANGQDIDNELNQLHPKLFDYTMNDYNHVKDYLDFNGTLGKLPCGHDDAVAQVSIAEYLYNQLTDRYNVTVEPSEYLKIKDFYTQSEQTWARNLGRGDWIL
jgi:hypothetical protein